MRLLAECFILARFLSFSRAAPPYAKLPDTLSPVATYGLNDGTNMPVIGLGVYMSQPGDEAYNAVKWALEAGYRMIDTAAIYGNEESVGKAVAESGIPRSELWITTKLWDSDHGYDATIRALEKSLKALQMDYLDLYLVHSPQSGKIVETWDAMVAMKKAGKIRSIGVSNYGIKHLEALKAHGRPLPSVNQIEMHPMNYQERVPLLDFCKQEGILTQAYGSIFFGKTEFLDRPEVTSVVKAHPGATAAHVLLRWGLQMGFQIIPKSVKQHRIVDNLKVLDFSLSDAELQILSGMQGTLGAYWQPLDAQLDVGDTSRGKAGEL